MNRPYVAPAAATNAWGYPASWTHPRGRDVRSRFPPLQRAQIVELACLEPVAEGLHITDTEQEISAIFEHQESATTRVSFFVSFPRVGSKPSPSLSRSSRTRCNSGSASLFRSREQLPWVRAPWSLVGRNKPAAGRPFQLSCSPSLSSQARAIC